MPTLSELHVEHGRCFPDNAELYWLRFDCPLHGAAYPCTIKFHRAGADEPAGVWTSTGPWKVWPGLEHLGATPDIGVLTLQPSVRYNTHGRKRPTCGAHFVITEGRIVLDG